MDQPQNKAPLSPKAARELLWHKGTLDFKLDILQRDIKKAFYESLTDNRKKVHTWLLSRRIGKSTALCAIAIEHCIKQKNCIVKFLSPEIKQTKTIVKPLIMEMIEDCPENLRPVFRPAENVWRFPNGSEIHCAGNDSGGAEKLRGSKAHLCIVDEAGFCDDLKYTVRSILLPTLLTTNGKLILSSTPPKIADHEFMDFVEEADDKKLLIKKTIYDSPRYSREFIDREILSQYVGGMDDPEFQREYLVMSNNNTETSVVPEFTDELQKEVVRTWDRPTHFDAYVSLDYGVTDNTAVLFAYYDFKHAKLIIDDEIVMNGSKMNTEILAGAISNKEEMLWSDKYTLEPIPPYLRVSDNNLLLIQDMVNIHGLNFVATEKTGKEGFLNQVRLMLQDKRIIINPKCTHLINHLKYAQWDKNRSKMRRSATYGHYDTLDALVYLIRNVVFSKNPYPDNGHSGEVFVSKERQVMPENLQTIKSMFTPSKKEPGVPIKFASNRIKRFF